MMEIRSTRVPQLLLAVWLVSAVPGTAYAYLDPGTGSFMIQMLVAGFLGAVLYVKVAWQSIKYFFRNLFSSNKEASQGIGEDDNP